MFPRNGIAARPAAGPDGSASDNTNHLRSLYVPKTVSLLGTVVNVSMSRSGGGLGGARTVDVVCVKRDPCTSVAISNRG